LYDGQYELIISSDILLEYEEKIAHFFGYDIAESFLSFLSLLPNVRRIDPYFQLSIIIADPDDNKFIDCAFAGNAHYIVTNDKHFRVLNNIEFPKISVITAEDFNTWLQH
jgi:putative PIN family toxin of toxin-antitoxin system